LQKNEKDLHKIIVSLYVIGILLLATVKRKRTAETVCGCMPSKVYHLSEKSSSDKWY
jgi:hypothetical protein